MQREKGVRIMKDEEWMQYLTLQQENQEVALQKQKADLMNCNTYTTKFGLQLSEQEAQELLVERKESLKREGRVEFGEGILRKLIYAFCDSSYIYQDNYVDTMERLQEIFYLYKNECLDEVTDDELIAYMKERFDGICQGDLEYLEDTALESIARKIRRGEW